VRAVPLRREQGQRLSDSVPLWIQRLVRVRDLVRAGPTARLSHADDTTAGVRHSPPLPCGAPRDHPAVHRHTRY